MVDTETCVVQVYVNRQQYAALVEMAQAREVSVSQLVQARIENYIKYGYDSSR